MAITPPTTQAAMTRWAVPRSASAKPDVVKTPAPIMLAMIRQTSEVNPSVFSPVAGAGEGMRRIIGGIYGATSARSTGNSPIFTQVREPCLPKTSTLASTNSRFCSICCRDCVPV